jgi:hypothetical protein
MEGARMIEVGTRVRQNTLTIKPDQGRMTRTFTRDLGLKSNVTASITFTTTQLTAANGTFSNFTLNQVILVEGTNLNNGYKTITAIDGVNGAFLTVSPPPVTEGPLTATVRTA